MAPVRDELSQKILDYCIAASNTSLAEELRHETQMVFRIANDHGAPPHPRNNKFDELWEDYISNCGAEIGDCPIFYDLPYRLAVAGFSEEEILRVTEQFRTPMSRLAEMERELHAD